VVRRVFEHHAYTDLAFHAEARALDARDRALAMRLAYGTVQRRGTLDHLIERLADRPVRRLDAPVRAALRLGLYELCYLRGAPARAIVADAVELAKAASPGGRAGAGLVNAVLRRGASEAATMLGQLDDETPHDAALMHSHPEWIADMWWRELGAETARALMAANNEPAESALRVNTLRAEPDALRAALPVPARRDPWLPEALVLEGPLDLQQTQAWRNGLCVAQSRAAMLVARALAPQSGGRVLDLCAAPGGKSTHLAALMHGRGEVVAVERNPIRARALARTARRLGAQNIRVEVADARVVGTRKAPSALREAVSQGFDGVLLDPPCSGLGTLQAHPDLRWRMNPERIEQMASDQAVMLERAAAVLRPGGVLVYSTCTISPTENERLVGAFLHSHRGFELEGLGERWPDLRLPRNGDGATSRALAGKALLTLPHRDHTAGFFIARLRRA
jgi:16S rRNA (cytosine967-C5)-methyltransferase